MATIWDNKNHEEGSMFILSKNSSTKTKSAFKKYLSPYTKIDKKKGTSIYIKGKDEETFWFKDAKNKIVQCTVPNSYNSQFTWINVGGKSESNDRTELKEVCSLIAVLDKMNKKNKIKTIEDMVHEIQVNYKSIKINLMRDVYFSSAMKHANLTTNNKFTFSEQYIGERQKDNFTKDLYTLARKLTSKAPDNWNPSDIWIIRKSYLSTYKKELARINKIPKSQGAEHELIYWMNYQMKIGNLFGISLKQISANDKGSSDLITYDSIKQSAQKMNFSVTKCYMRKSDTLPAYGVLETKSGFSIKWGGRANAQQANMNAEGHIKGNNYQLGAIDAKILKSIFNSNNVPLLRDSDFSKQNIDVQFKKVKKYLPSELKTELKDSTADDYDYVELKRFIACTYFWYFFNSLNEDEILNMFMLAKKALPTNPEYWLFH